MATPIPIHFKLGEYTVGKFDNTNSQHLTHKKGTIYLATNNLFSAYLIYDDGTNFLDIIPRMLGYHNGGVGLDLTAAPPNATFIQNSTQNSMTWIASAEGAYYSTGTNITPTFGTLPVNCGGTGNTAFTSLRAIYAETATKLSSSGHYMSSSKLAVNSTSEPSYQFYVNGTSYFNGNVTATQFYGTLNGNATGLKGNTTLNTDAAINNFIAANTFKTATWNSTSSPGVANGIILSGAWVSASYGFQIAIDDDPTWYIALRQRNASGWKAWKRIPMGDGTGASGTWDINITGNAATATTLQTTRTIFGHSFNGSASIEGQPTVYGTYISDAAHRYYNSGIQVRENGLVGSAQSDIGYAPSIGFHWAQRIAGTLLFNSDGNFYLRKQDGISRASLDANLIGNATTANKASTLLTADIGDIPYTHATALQNYFNSNKASITRNQILSFYSSAYGNGAQYIGYFLYGYDDNPYGGFYVAHYGTPYYVGIQNGYYIQSRILLEGSLLVTRNYGTAIPDSSTNGYGNTGSIYFKLI